MERLTDNEIIKALKCCGSKKRICSNCTFVNIWSGKCIGKMAAAALDLINRQKAELEGLRKSIGICNSDLPVLPPLRLSKSKKVIHGEWQVCSDEYEICADEFVCSCCKESFVTSELTDEQFLQMMKYCPNCGAKMDGERR